MFVPRGKSPDSKKKWLIPFVFAAQVLLKHFVFDKCVRSWDLYHGDEWGPKPQEFKDNKYIREAKEKRRRKLQKQEGK